MKKSIKKSIKKSVKKLTRKHLLDIDYIKKITPRLHELKTTLKKIENKRVGLFANRAYFSNEPSMGQKENCTLKFKKLMCCVHNTAELNFRLRESPLFIQ